MLRRLLKAEYDSEPKERRHSEHCSLNVKPFRLGGIIRMTHVGLGQSCLSGPHILPLKVNGIDGMCSSVPFH